MRWPHHSATSTTAGPPNSNDIRQTSLANQCAAKVGGPAEFTARTNLCFLFISVFVCFYRFEGSLFETALKLPPQPARSEKSNITEVKIRYKAFECKQKLLSISTFWQPHIYTYIYTKVDRSINVDQTCLRLLTVLEPPSRQNRSVEGQAETQSGSWEP